MPRNICVRLRHRSRWPKTCPRSSGTDCDSQNLMCTPSYKRNASNDFRTKPIETVSARERLHRFERLRLVGSLPFLVIRRVPFVTGCTTRARIAVPWNPSLGLGYGQRCPKICLHDLGTNCGDQKLVSKTQLWIAIPRNLCRVVCTTRKRIAVIKYSCLQLGHGLLCSEIYLYDLGYAIRSRITETSFWAPQSVPEPRLQVSGHYHFCPSRRDKFSGTAIRARNLEILSKFPGTAIGTWATRYSFWAPQAVTELQSVISAFSNSVIPARVIQTIWRKPQSVLSYTL